MSDERRRLVFLDVFRGLTVAFMIIVVTPGTWAHVYAPLRHAVWDGLTPTDLVFPYFLFIVGVSMVFSLDRRMAQGEPFRTTFMHVLKRGAIIFVLGLVISFDYVHYVPRIPGVLQRIALCYVATAAIVLATKSSRVRLGIGAGLVAVYWVLMKYVPVPGYGAGVLAPSGNMAGYIDAFLMKGYLYMPAQEPGPDFDPEGILSTLPAIANTLLGYLIGELVLRKKAAPFSLFARMAAAGTVMCALGLALQPAFPINKALWTPSYAVVTSGLATLTLALVYWVVEMNAWRGWTPPFLVLGANTIGIYFLSSMTSKARAAEARLARRPRRAFPGLAGVPGAGLAHVRGGRAAVLDRGRHVDVPEADLHQGLVSDRTASSPK
jgi:predicted acyltransferase